MKKILFATFLLICFIALAIVFFSPPKKSVEIEFFTPDNQVITKLSAPIADSNKERQTGLMFRDSLPNDEGLLFVFNGFQKHAMWMKNMRFPIDLIFLDEKKDIIKIYENLPPCETLDCPSYPSEKPAVYAIEMNSGYIANHQITSNTKIYFDIDKK
jgi:hypothetical protein